MSDAIARGYAERAHSLMDSIAPIHASMTPIIDAFVLDSNAFYLLMTHQCRMPAVIQTLKATPIPEALRPLLSNAGTTSTTGTTTSTTPGSSCLLDCLPPLHGVDDDASPSSMEQQLVSLTALCGAKLKQVSCYLC
jgi:hypothetical protein